MAQTDIEVGCTVLDREDNAWRVTAINRPKRVTTDLGVIVIKIVEVTDGVNTATRLLGELDRAEMMSGRTVLARGCR